MINDKKLPVEYGLAGVVSLLAFVNYWRGLAPSVTAVFDDSLEFALVVHRLAIAHPTGYPLYILLGKFISLFNPANVAGQLNLFSAICAALTVGLVYLLALALMPPTLPTVARHSGSLVGAMLFSVGPVFYSQSVTAEVYTLNALAVAGCLLLTMRQKWLWLAFGAGLGLTHHRTILLVFPAIMLTILSHYRLANKTGRQHLLTDFPPLKTAIAFVAPLLLYLYLPLRGRVGTLEGTYSNTWIGFWQHVTGGGYSTFLVDNPLGQSRNAEFYLSLIKTELGWYGIGLALLGLIVLIRQKQVRGLLLTGLALITFAGFNLLYAVADIEVFFIPIFLLATLWIGVGIAGLMALLPRRLTWFNPVMAILAIIILMATQQGQSRANTWNLDDYGTDILASADPNAAIVGIQGQLSLLRYLQETRRLRPDLITLRADLESERLTVVEHLLTDNPTAPVYLLGTLPGAAEKWSLTAKGPLIRVNTKPVIEIPVVDIQLNAAITGDLQLVGYNISRPPSHLPIAPVRLSLVWQAQHPLTADLKVSARLLDQTGAIIAVIDSTPVHFAYPTTLWQPGTYITDVYDLQPAANTPPGTYTPLLIVYNPANNAAEVGRISLTPISLNP